MDEGQSGETSVRSEKRPDDRPFLVAASFLSASYSSLGSSLSSSYLVSYPVPSLLSLLTPRRGRRRRSAPKERE